MSKPDEPAPPIRIDEYLTSVAKLKLPGGAPLVSIALFGSAALGGFTAEVSDVDLIVVLPDSASRDDRRRIRDQVLNLEIAHGFRTPASLVEGRLERLAGRAAGHAMSSFICSRSGLLSGDVARIIGLSRFEALFVDRMVLAGVIVSAVTAWGEDLLPEVPVPPLRRLDVFKSLFNFVNIILMSAMAFPLLPHATEYAVGVLKHALHSCYLCYHLQTAPLEKEIEFIHSRLGHSRALSDLLELRRTHVPSFSFVVSCLPLLCRMHFRTALDNRFPRTVTRMNTPA